MHTTQARRKQYNPETPQEVAEQITNMVSLLAIHAVSRTCSNNVYPLRYAVCTSEKTPPMATMLYSSVYTTALWMVTNLCPGGENRCHGHNIYLPKNTCAANRSQARDAPQYHVHPKNAAHTKVQVATT